MSTAKKTDTANVPAQAVESKYFIAELVTQHKLFGTSKELVHVALKLSGKKEFTVEEARNIIETYKKKEVY